MHFKGLKIDEKLTSANVNCYGIVKADANLAAKHVCCHILEL